MKNYRIIKKTYPSDRVHYKVQERVFLIFWTDTTTFRFEFVDLINCVNGHRNDPINLVGKTHQSYEDALKEVDYHEKSDFERRLIKKEVI